MKKINKSGIVFKKDKFINWDYGSKEGDIGCEIYGRYNKRGKWIIENIKYQKFKKGGEEVRPYFETKVVKVKKEECQHEYKVLHYRCIKCGEEYKREYEADTDGSEPKLKGNWVNGENLDKIKFPCFCSYSNDDEKGIGFFSVSNGYYYIANINFQKKAQDDISNGCYDLKEFIMRNNVHILRGKVIIFEEE